MSECPLCLSPKFENHFIHRNRIFFKCPNCSLIFLGESDLLSSNEERKHYESHNNDFRDTGYRKFLSKLLNPLKKYLSKKDKGIDFGCGPGPAISKYLYEDGISCSNYDPYFFNDETVLLEDSYDFLTCTEVIEHINFLSNDLEKIVSLVKKGGHIGFMTEFSPTVQEDLQKWWYLNDPTHIRAFSISTFEWIAKKYNLKILENNKNIVIYERK